MNQTQWRLCSLLFFFWLPLASLGELHSYARINDDGSLQISGRKVHLYGIYLPESGHSCQTILRPVECGQRSVLALKFKIQGFVRCEEKSVNQDRSINAVCRVGVTRASAGEDLAAYLLRQGWAVALPEAPFEYHVLEGLARRQSVGIWGFPVDSIQW
jgi:endonuclease YncB( thermonuclease family)